jgi:hypothetical protein
VDRLSVYAVSFKAATGVESSLCSFCRPLGGSMAVLTVSLESYGGATPGFGV